MVSSMLASECELVWVFWIFFFCITNCSVVISCVEELSMYSSSTTATTTTTETTKTIQVIKKTEQVKEKEEEAPVIQSYDNNKKRKEREDTFGLACDEIFQGRVKRRRVFKPVFLRNIPRRRTFSFGDAMTKSSNNNTTMEDLRRVVSCSDLSEQPEIKNFLKQQATLKVQVTSTKVQATPSRHTKLETILRETSRQVRGFLVANLEKAIKNAVDEIISSLFSFVTYAAIVFLVRQYSGISVGVSLDLGAFSIEL